MARDQSRWFGSDRHLCEHENRWRSDVEMLWIPHDPGELEQRHQIGLSWDDETAMWIVETSAGDLHHLLFSLS